MSLCEWVALAFGASTCVRKYANPKAVWESGTTSFSFAIDQHLFVSTLFVMFSILYTARAFAGWSAQSRAGSRNHSSCTRSPHTIFNTNTYVRSHGVVVPLRPYLPSPHTLAAPLVTVSVSNQRMSHRTDASCWLSLSHSSEH
jgi:hypothetical protein